MARCSRGHYDFPKDLPRCKTTFGTEFTYLVPAKKDAIKAVRGESRICCNCGDYAIGIGLRVLPRTLRKRSIDLLR
ncbi:unnamed protein product [Leptosia nina]|uniref:Uncharacterized protein n=1 Tax=Leptosia nina TaxID=320188 RepID=A0AAV1JGD3_9NEOP